MRPVSPSSRAGDDEQRRQRAIVPIDLLAQRSRLGGPLPTEDAGDPQDRPGGAPPWDQDAAMRTAGQLNGEDAGMRLAERLRLAWVTAGRPPMSVVGDRVGYSKASISKVLSGKMPPAWRLVVKLGHEFGVSVTTVQSLWQPLWIAAANHRWKVPPQQTTTERPGGGRTCDACGCWVMNPGVHQTWHQGLEGPETRTSEAHQWALLRDSLPRRHRGRPDNGGTPAP